MQFAMDVERVTPARRIVTQALAKPAELDRARALLEGLMAERDAVLALPLKRPAAGYERNFLFGDEAFSVYAIVWAAGAATPVHDHHCACCFGVIAGEIAERWFDRVSETRAVQTREAIRKPGFLAAMAPSGPNIHQMINRTDREAISIHVYTFDHTRRASSIDREYEV